VLRTALGLVWELPQTLLGLAALGNHLARGRIVRMDVERGCVVAEIDHAHAISLGRVVLWTPEDNPYVPVGPENRAHELGHAVQSRWLGPLYLPLVGVPSTARVLYALAHKRVTGRRWGGYYDGWPERSADRLGRADRARRPLP
jgi:hypothetical protein